MFYPIPKDLADSIIDTVKNKTISKDIEKIKNFIFIKLYNYMSICLFSDHIKNNKILYDAQFSEMDNLVKMEDHFDKYKSKCIKDFSYYVEIARAMGRIFPIIYFSLLLIFVVGSGALLIILIFAKK